MKENPEARSTAFHPASAPDYIPAPLLRDLVKECLDSGQLSVIVARRNCLLAAGKIKEYERCDGAAE